MSDVDSIKGAIELAERLADVESALPAPTTHVPEDAPPIFHWLGVTPSTAAGTPDAAPAV